MRIGIDIGRVLVCPTIDGEHDTRFLGCTVEEALPTPSAAGAFEVVRELMEATGGKVWLVSKCGPGVESKTRAWLKHQGFHRTTGMSPSHLRFCRKRADKALHCRQLRIDAFLDDRVDVLGHLAGVVDDRLLFGEQERPAPSWATHLVDWREVRAWFAGRVKV